MKTRIAIREKAAENKSINRSKSRYNQSPKKVAPSKSTTNMKNTVKVEKKKVNE